MKTFSTAKVIISCSVIDHILRLCSPCYVPPEEEFPLYVDDDSWYFRVKNVLTTQIWGKKKFLDDVNIEEDSYAQVHLCRMSYWFESYIVEQLAK